MNGHHPCLVLGKSSKQTQDNLVPWDPVRFEVMHPPIPVNTPLGSLVPPPAGTMHAHPLQTMQLETPSPKSLTAAPAPG